MHNQDASGTEFFICDFCRKPWADDRPMIEGHKGSLICCQCIATAYVEVIHLRGGEEHTRAKCVMCLETRPEPAWQSPLHPESIVCKRCIRQSAATLEHDPDYGWKRPKAPAGAAETGAAEEDDEFDGDD